MLKNLGLLIPIILVIFYLFPFTSNGFENKSSPPSDFEKVEVPIEVYKRLYYQIEVKNYLGAQILAKKVFEKAKNTESKEIAFLMYWEASGFYHYKTLQFPKILEDLGGLNLYWYIFKENRKHEDLYYSVLGKLYTLLFQYRRAVIFFLEAYKRNPSPERLLDIIYAVEMAYYNELRPYYNFKIIEKLLKKVNPRELDTFQRALFEFEKGFYHLLTGRYKEAYKLLKKSYDLDRSYLTDGQANFFMGKALEGSGKLKDAYYYYKQALTQVKHPIYKLRVLMRLFFVSARLGYYQEANDYLYGLATFGGGIRSNPYLQEALLKIPSLGDFLNHFYWRKEYPAIVAKIMWLNFNNDRGRRAFALLLNRFLETGCLYPDFVDAWSLYYPDEVEDVKISPEKVLSLSVEGLKNLAELYRKNRNLFEHFFGEYGYLALAKYYFFVGKWQKAESFLKSVKLRLPDRFFIEGVIEAYRGKPYLLEVHYPSFKGDYKTQSLFWLGWGYLLNGRWDLVNLYWDRFLSYSEGNKGLTYERLFAAYYLGLHQLELGYSERAVRYLDIAYRDLQKVEGLEGLKRFVSLKLAELQGDKFLQRLDDKEWQKFLEYILVEENER